MTKRRENLQFKDINGQDIPSLLADSKPVIGEPFFNGPTEFLVKAVVDELLTVPQWSELFGEFITPYRRMDYPIRAFPAIRIYNETYIKEFDSWFINGDIKADVIWPADLRRYEQQQFPDTVCAALLQQFRRPTFFNNVSNKVPGLNELGKTFTVDKSLGFEWQDEVCPLTQITVNFRLDLRQWDLYLEETNRTKDDPFEVTLTDLKKIASEIQALKDDEVLDVTVPLEQKV